MLHLNRPNLLEQNLGVAGSRPPDPEMPAAIARPNETKKPRKPTRRKRHISIQSGVEVALEDRKFARDFRDQVTHYLDTWITELGEFKDQDDRKRLTLLHLVALKNAPTPRNIHHVCESLQRLLVARPKLEKVIVPNELRQIMVDAMRLQRDNAVKIAKNTALLEDRKMRSIEKYEEFEKIEPTMAEIDS